MASHRDARVPSMRPNASCKPLFGAVGRFPRFRTHGRRLERRDIGPRARSDACLNYPKGTRQRDALRRGMALKETLERRAHRLSLLGR